MRFKQKPNKTIDEFVNRCRSKAKECDFKDAELSERLVELVIASTPIEAFQKDLLDKPKGFSIDDMNYTGRIYEAIMADHQCLQTLDNNPNVDAISPSKKSCGSCGLPHPQKTVTWSQLPCNTNNGRLGVLCASSWRLKG